MSYGKVFDGEEALKFMPREKRSQMFKVAIDMLQFARGSMGTEQTVDLVSGFLGRVTNYTIPREWMLFVVEAWDELDRKGSIPGIVDNDVLAAQVIQLYRDGGTPIRDDN